MIKGLQAVIIGSENPKALADFYHDKVGLKITEEGVMGEGDSDESNVFQLDLEYGSLGIYAHSKVKGQNSQPDRVMFNLEVDEPIEGVAETLVKNGVKQVQEVYHLEGFGKISTFEDVDGNYFQLVQIREM